MGGAEKALGRDLGKVVALAEDYPDLKADAAFRGLMTDLVEIEDQIQYSRRYYNGSVRQLNTKIELLEPLGEGSPVANFLEKNKAGGMHHVCYEVEDIKAAAQRLQQNGMRILGDGEPKIGAHDKPVLFLHPKDFAGTLLEIEQV